MKKKLYVDLKIFNMLLEIFLCGHIIIIIPHIPNSIGELGDEITETFRNHKTVSILTVFDRNLPKMY